MGTRHDQRIRATMLEELMCPICLELMQRPATLVCGHSGCLTCLTMAIYNAGHCPQCRASHGQPLSVNVALRNIMHKLQPQSCQEEQLKRGLPCQEQQAVQLRGVVGMHEKPNLLNMLLCGYNPNSRLRMDGNNALGRAVNQNELELAKILIDHGADVDLQDTDGDTALMNAAYFRRPQVMQLLLERGADPTLLSVSGLTALDYAQRPGTGGAQVDKSLVEMLKSAVATWAPSHKAKPQVGMGFDESIQDTDEESYEILPLINGPQQMTVSVAAPVVRTGVSPMSAPIGRLKQGDTVVAEAYAERGNVCYLQFDQGPSHCPKGWLPFYLPTSTTQVLAPILEQPEHRDQEGDGHRSE